MSHITTHIALGVLAGCSLLCHAAEPPRPELEGVVGQALKLSRDNRLKLVDYDFMVGPFARRDEKDGGWRCEFWGKVTRSAILTNYWMPDAELSEKIAKSVQGILASQTADGCVSSYPYELQKRRWDIWGRKYILLGLMRYYELQEQKPEVLDCCRRIADHLMTQVGPDKTDILACGEHGGLAASSILVAIVELYNLTKDSKYLDYARWLASRGCSGRHNVYGEALSGTPPSNIGNSKAYELTSCFEGLAELYLIDRKPEYREACRNYFNGIRQRETFVTGVSGLKDSVGEYWYEGAARQHRSDCGALGETCITATWLHYCQKIAALFPDDTAPYDEAEKAIYNGLLGAMKPDGSDWCHANPTPLTGNGAKIPAGDQIGSIFKTPFDRHDCCRAQGPEGLACVPYFLANMLPDGTVKLNIFEPMTVTFAPGVTLKVSGNYPIEPEVRIRFSSDSERTLKLRIPEFCTAVTLNGKDLAIRRGEYLALRRAWNSTSDEVVMTFDFSLKEVSAPGDGGYVAVKRGPLVLAEDNFGDVTFARVHEDWNGHKLVDYASAGGMFRRENTLTVWFKK